MDTTDRTRRRLNPLARIAWLAAIGSLVLSCAYAGTAAPATSPTPDAPAALTPVPGSDITPPPPSRPPATPAPRATAAPAPAPTPTPTVPEADDVSLAALYAALRPENLRPEAGPRRFARGATARFAYEMVNGSHAWLTVPQTTTLDRPGAWYGVTQTWIERRGDDASLDACLPGAARKGTWYALGGWVSELPYAAGVTVVPGEAMTVSASIPGQVTACLPVGRYRYHIEYKRLDASDPDDVIAATKVDLVLVDPVGWTARIESGGLLGSSTIRIDPATGRGTGSLALTGLAPGSTRRVDIRAGGCDGTGRTTVAAFSVTAAGDGTYHGHLSFKASRSARRAIAAGDALGIRLADGSAPSCSVYEVLPPPVPAHRAPTTWGGALLRDEVDGGLAIVASSETFAGRPAKAIDGRIDNLWNSGDMPPGWVELDLRHDTTITGLRLMPSQLPNVADTVHRIYGRADGSRTERLLTVLDGETRDGTWIDVALERPVRVRYVRVETVRSPSWVAWREITILGSGLPGPSAMPQGTHDGSTLLHASGDTCYANGWASDPDDRMATVAVRVLVDGAEVWIGPASESRPDVAAAGLGDGTTGFWVRLENIVTHGVEHEIRVQARDDATGRWVDLNSTPRRLTCG